MDYGQAMLVAEEHRLYCFNCKEGDHKQFNCCYATLKDWKANAGDNTKIEEIAEFVPSIKSHGNLRGNKHRGFSRGGSRGSGGRGSRQNRT